MMSEQGPHGVLPASVVRVELRRSGNGTALSERAAEVPQSPMFSAISLTDREQIDSSAREKTFLPGEAVFQERGPVQRISLIAARVRRLMGKANQEVDRSGIVRLIGRRGGRSGWPR
jgi:hypothetical protein